jgi:hypothetical protein
MHHMRGIELEVVMLIKPGTDKVIQSEAVERAQISVRGELA